MRKLLLKILELIPYRTRFGLSLADCLKLWYFANISEKKCICGGRIRTNYHQYNYDEVGWETFCGDCEMLYGED
jgi:hypothetical protein